MTCLFRINCGSDGGDVYTDREGRQWLPDQLLAPGREWGAIEGMRVDRDEALPPVDPAAPELFRTERYGMKAYEFHLPDACYEVRLHFAETFECSYRAGGRSIDVSLNGLRLIHELDPFTAAGGYGKPVVKTFSGIGAPRGKLTIGFNDGAMINAIEIFKTGTTAPPQRKRRKILFVGNSHTFFWAMSLSLENFINTLPNDFHLEVHRALIGGKDMAYHHDNTDVMQKIAEGRFDDVVVQSMKMEEADALDKLAIYAPKYAAATNAAGSRLFMYCTWPQKGSPLSAFDPWAQPHLEIAKKLGMTFVPAGPAWKEALTRRPELKLYNASATDMKHSGLWGAYLTTCVFYSVLTGKSAVGLPATSLIGTLPVDESTAKFLQQVAWDTVCKFRG